MRVKARAVIWIDGLLIVAEQSRQGRKELTLPGGRVNGYESVIDALKREVAEETGLDIDPGQLVYVSEIVESVRTRNLELVFLAEATGVPSLRGAFKTIDLDSDERPAIRPVILEQIASDVQSDWRETPKWLGNVRQATVWDALDRTLTRPAPPPIAAWTPCQSSRNERFALRDEARVNSAPGGRRCG